MQQKLPSFKYFRIESWVFYQLPFSISWWQQQDSNPWSYNYLWTILLLCHWGTTKLKLFTLPFLSPGVSGSSQNLDHRIMSWVFYHCASWVQPNLANFLHNSPGDSGSIQNIDLRIMSRVLYRCATGVQATEKKFPSIFSLPVPVAGFECMTLGL